MRKRQGLRWHHPRQLLKLVTHKRTRGILVPASVAASIRAADTRRAAGDWSGSTALYERALADAPKLAHIWVQLGHAYKEIGEYERAGDAYRRAAALGTEGSEPFIHLGQIAKSQNDLSGAAHHYLEALRREPDSLSAAVELMRCVDASQREGAALVTEAALSLGLPMPQPRIDPDRQGGSQYIYLDVSDLLAYFSHARLPTGIQRVQIELVAAIIRQPETEHVRACCYADARRGWTELPRDQFLAVAAAALASDDRNDPNWRQVVISATLGLAANVPIRFKDGDTLLNVGTSWSEQNYFVHLQNVRASVRIAYVAIIYDLIPTFAPHWFPASLVRDYLEWLKTVVDNADGYIAISEATRNDLVRIAGIDVPIATLPLNADFRADRASTTVGGTLSRFGLTEGSFVLMVSTIEPRKNHVGAFDAWLELIRTVGARAVPTLVCVGGRGWMNDHIYGQLRANAQLRKKVRLLHGVNDAELDALYRECLFTLYPSFYEGWGLPVTESLCYGKIPVVSNVASLPEAGGPFAIYFDPSVEGDLARAARRCITDRQWRQEHEAQIVAHFRPQSWAALGKTALAFVRKLPIRKGHPGSVMTASTAPGSRYHSRPV